MRFDACADTYDLHAGPQRAFAAHVAEFAQVSSPCDILELGAGTGALTALLCALPAVHVRATDVSRGMIDIGRRRVSNASWSVMDAFAGPVPPAKVQISSGLLQWAPDPVRVLVSWSSALRAGDRMVHGFPCHPCLSEWRALVPDTPLTWRNEAEWRAILAAAGLKLTRSQCWIRQFTFPDAHQMLRQMHSTGVTGKVRMGPGKLREKLRTYDELHRTSNGVKATWAWLAIEAVRA